MGTPNSPTDFVVAEIIGHGWTEFRGPEEKVLIEKANTAVREIVSKLRPVLRYISEEVLVSPDFDEPCKEHGVLADLPVRVKGLRAVEVFELEPEPRKVLFLSEDGTFFVASLCMSTRRRHFHELWREGERWTWQLVPFGALLEGLQSKLQAAVDRREKHLASIREHSDMLDRVLAAIKRSETA